MFFSYARPRRVLSALLLLLPVATARDETLFTSSVTYCAPPETLLIQQFDVAYIAKNNSILFNISAASVEPNVNVSANMQVNVYGMHPINLTIDLCSLLNGALCPLPMYNFTGMDSIALPSSLNVASHLPGIAYKIPDLEAFIQLTLVESSTGTTKACVQSTLSNGWSTHQKAVEWSTGALALFALVIALWQSLSPEAMVPFRLIDLLYLYQSIATTGFLNLNYPSVYRAFTLNFAWAMGLFTSSSMQESINNMRHKTGGDLADAGGGSVVGLVNRKMSPYNDVVTSPTAIIPALAKRVQDFSEHLSNALSSISTNYASPLGNSQQLVGADLSGDVAVVTTSNTLQAGVPVYANSIGIATANAFMTVFFTALILIAITLGVLGLGYLVVMLAARKYKNAEVIKDRFPAFARAWGLRLILVVFMPVTIFAFYQWSLKDSWLAILFAVLLFLFVLGGLSYSIYHTLNVARRDGQHALWTNSDHLASHGPLYGQYRTPRYYFTFILLIATFLKAIFVAFAKASGEAQLILMIVVELGVLGAYAVLKPYKARGGDVLATYLAVIRFVCTGLMIAFIEQLAVAAIPRVAIGILMAVLFSIAVIVLFINILLGLVRLFQTSRRHPHVDSADESIMEKGDISPSSTVSQEHFGRPRNPTPERNVPLDPNVNQPYPAFTPTHTTAEPPTPQSGTSETSLGSVLPRRWSFQQSHENAYTQESTSPHSTSSSARRSVPPSPLASHGHSRQPTIDEHSSSWHHAS